MKTNKTSLLRKLIREEVRKMVKEEKTMYYSKGKYRYLHLLKQKRKELSKVAGLLRR